MKVHAAVQQAALLIWWWLHRRCAPTVDAVRDGLPNLVACMQDSTVPIPAQHIAHPLLHPQGCPGPLPITFGRNTDIISSLHPIRWTTRRNLARDKYIALRDQFRIRPRDTLNHTNNRTTQQRQSSRKKSKARHASAYRRYQGTSTCRTTSLPFRQTAKPQKTENSISKHDHLTGPWGPSFPQPSHFFTPDFMSENHKGRARRAIFPAANCVSASCKSRQVTPVCGKLKMRSDTE